MTCSPIDTRNIGSLSPCVWLFAFTSIWGIAKHTSSWPDFLLGCTIPWLHRALLNLALLGAALLARRQLSWYEFTLASFLQKQVKTCTQPTPAQGRTPATAAVTGAMEPPLRRSCCSMSRVHHQPPFSNSHQASLKNNFAPAATAPSPCVLGRRLTQEVTILAGQLGGSLLYHSKQRRQLCAIKLQEPHAVDMSTVGMYQKFLHSEYFPRAHPERQIAIYIGRSALAAKDTFQELHAHAASNRCILYEDWQC